MTPAHSDLALNAVGTLGFSPSPDGVTLVVDSIDPATICRARLSIGKGHTATPAILHPFPRTACPAIAAGADSPVAVATHTPADGTAFSDCIAQLTTRFHLAVSYQPAGRYWTFQWIERDVLVGLALLLTGGSFL
jgi:hypothetical protein